MVRHFSAVTTALARKTYAETKGKNDQYFITLDKKELSRWHQALAPIEAKLDLKKPEGQWRMEGLKEILTTIRQELPKDNDL